jgi:hypothetical protein
MPIASALSFRSLYASFKPEISIGGRTALYEAAYLAINIDSRR